VDEPRVRALLEVFYLATKVLPFMVNYGKKLRIEADIRRKGNMEKSIEFVERLRKVQKEGWSSIEKSTRRDKETRI